MKNRAIALFFILAFVFSLTGLRIYYLSSDVQQVSGLSSSKSVDVATLRGTVYDCRMRPLTNGEFEYYSAAKPTNEALAKLKGRVLPEIFESVMERMSRGNPVAVKVDSYIEPDDGIITAKVPKRYCAAFTACHVIGSIDSDGNGRSGIEKSFDSILSRGSSTVSFRFSANASGRVMLGEDITVSGNEIPKNGVVLTLDRDIQQITEAALDATDTDCAAAVVIEIENGAVRACVSRPLYNQNDVSQSFNNEKSPLINRAFLPFSVGSVFKPVVAASALEKGISENFEYICTGSVTYNGVTFHCHKDDGHGIVDMESAVAYSCNTYFIALAIETGAENIIKSASDFGFGKETNFASGMISSAGNLPSAYELDSKAAVANISFGQGSLLATPVQICSMMATLARGGVYINPYLVEGETDENGNLTLIRRYEERKQIVSTRTAEKLKSYLEKVVEYGSGSRAKSDYVSVAGKTATAQTGRTENGEEIYNAWFAGYFPADNPKYAVAILKENGGEGALSCAPVFKMIAEKITVLI